MQFRLAHLVPRFASLRAQMLLLVAACGIPLLVLGVWYVATESAEARTVAGEVLARVAERAAHRIALDGANGYPSGPSPLDGRSVPAGYRLELRGAGGRVLSATGAPPDPQGKDRLEVTVPVAGQSWVVAASLAEADALAPYLRNVRQGLVLVTITVCLAMLFASDLSRRIVLPLRELASTAEQIAGGDETRRASPRGTKEIAELALSVNAMVDSLTRQREERRALVEHYGTLVDKARDIILLMNDRGELVDVNHAAMAAYGYAREEMLGLTIGDLRAPESIASMAPQWQASQGSDGVLFETIHRRKDGSLLPVEVSSSALEVGGKRYRQSHIRDISARRATEGRLARAHRALATLSDCNAILNRAEDEATLLGHVCRRVVESGGYRMAWIGCGVQEGDPNVRVVASAGHVEGYLNRSPISLRDDETGTGAAATAIRERKPVVHRSIAALDVVLPWRAAALSQGFGSVAAFPIEAPGHESRHALAIYAAESGAFDEDEVQRLRELADNLAFGIRSQRDRAALALQSRRAAALLALPEAAERLDEKAFLQFGLRLAEDLTQSTIAFIHLIHPDQETIELVTWSERTIAGFCHAAPENHSPQARAGLWAEALRRREPLVVNDYGAAEGRRGLPAGHAALARFASVPVIEGSLVRMIAGVGNKQGDYKDFDVETLRLIANAMWRIIRQRRADAELVKLSLAVEQSPDGVIIAGVDGRIEYVNDSLVRITGYPREELVGRNPRLLQSGLTPRETYEALWNSLQQGSAWSGTFANRRKDGRDYVAQAQIAPLRSAAGRITHYVAIQADVTQRIQLERELDRHRHGLEKLVAERTAQLEVARQRAEAASEAKSAFLANMSHEIRTPMNAILGLAHLLSEDHPTPLQAERLAQVDASARHLLAVLGDILDLAAVESGRLALDATPFELGDVLNQVRAIVAEPAQAKGLTLDVEAPLGETWLRGDATRVRQALLNYASNAVKFTDLGGLAVRAEIAEETREGTIVRFEVRDTGIGIDPAVLARLFAPFEQGELEPARRQGGTGLGLAITRRLARAMGGDGGAESQPGRGSLFWFTARFPRATPAAAPVRTAAPDSVARIRRDHAGARILVAEDNPVNREVARHILASLGLTVETASDGAEAVARVARGGIDLVLMDMQMPVLDGLEATCRIRALAARGRLPIIAMTANVFPQDKAACLEAGMDDLVGKPVDVPVLARTLLRHLAGGDPAAPEDEAMAGSPPDEGSAVDWPGIDHRALRARLGGTAHIPHLLGMFVAGHGDYADRIRADLQAGRWAQARARLHALRGAAANLAFGAVAANAARLEDGLAGGIVPPDADDVVNAISRAIAALAARLPQNPAPPSGPEGTEPAEGALERLEHLLHACDAEAIAWCQRHQAAIRERLGPRAGEFLEAANGYRFDEARALLVAAKPAGEEERGVA